MPKLFAVFNWKSRQIADDRGQYLRDTRIPESRDAPWCASFKTWKVDSALGLAVSEPEGAPLMTLGKSFPMESP